MSRRKCRGCGNEYDLIGTKSKCPYCNTVLESDLINSSLDERLFNARNLRRVGRFNDARSEYLSVIDMNSNIKEAHFGLFLCDYEVREYRLSGKTVTLCKSTSCNKISAVANEYFVAAVKNSANKEIWENVMRSIERQRRFNVKMENLMPSFSLLLLANPCSRFDCAMADKIYSVLKKRMDVLYPPRTFCNIDKSLWNNCTHVAMKRITVAAVISSTSASVLSKSSIADLYRAFRDTHNDYQLIPIVAGSGNISLDMFKNPADARCIKYDPRSPDFNGIFNSLFDKMISAGTWFYNEMQSFKQTGKIFLNGTAESPVLPPIK